MTLIKNPTAGRRINAGSLYSVAFGLLLLLSVLSSTSARAAKDAEPASPTTPAEAQALVAKLPDAQVRELLLEHLTSGLETSSTKPDAAPWLYSGSQIALQKLSAMAAQAGNTGTHLRAIADNLAGDARNPWLALFGGLLVAVVLAGLLERFLRRPTGVLARFVAPRPGVDPKALNLGNILLGALADIVGIVAFLAAALFLVTLAPGLSPGTRALASALVWVIGGTRLAATVIRALIAPLVQTTPPLLSPTTAGVIRRYVALFTCFLLLHVTVRELLRQSNSDGYFTLLVAVFTSGVMVASVLLGIFAVHSVMRSAETTPAASGALGVLREKWHHLAGLYVVVIYILGVYKGLSSGESALLPGLASLALVLAIPALDLVVRKLVVWMTRKKSSEDAPDGGAILATTNSRYQDALVLNIRVLLGIGVIKIVAQLWGIDIRAFIEAVFGDQAAGAVFQIAFSVLFAFIIWQLVKAGVAAHDPSAAEQDEPEESGADAGGIGRSRAQTVLPIISKTVAFALITMIVIITLTAFGVNIGPLLAGAGVLGLAIGFGAQSLVADLVSGFFFLIDDAFRMGEYVVVGPIKGTVEKISLRSLRLRHHNGPVHTLPYGEIRSITNLSRDYAIMKFEFRIPFETDVELVRKIIKKVGQEIQEDETINQDLLEPLKSQGVNRMDDSSFVIRCKFTAIPGKQFLIRRVAFAKIQAAFEKHGIKFAPKRVIVETATPADSQLAIAAAGAAAATETPATGQAGSGQDTP